MNETLNKGFAEVFKADNVKSPKYPLVKIVFYGTEKSSKVTKLTFLRQNYACSDF